MLALLLLWIGFGALVGFIGSEKGRSGFGWFLSGCVFGIFALVAVIAVPRRDV